MKKYIITTVIILCITAILYLFRSFISLTFDVAKWEIRIRFVIAMCLIAASVSVIINRHD